MARGTRIALDIALASGKALRPVVSTAWQYAKTELVPPMTLSFFHGPVGASLEKSIAAAADGAISGLQKAIKQIEAAEARRIKQQEDERKAAEEKLKADAKKLAEEKKKKEADKKAEDAKKAEKAQPQKDEEAKPKTKGEKSKQASPKAEKKKEPAKKPARKQAAKTKRTSDKKGSPPKPKK